jgi:threonine dehydrogenase-like Zn-dependent dehydrogenase
VGAYAYGSEGLAEGKSTFSLALDMLGRQGWSEKLAPLVTHRFPLEQHKQAFLTAMEVGKHGAVKVAFDMRDGA